MSGNSLLPIAILLSTICLPVAAQEPADSTPSAPWYVSGGAGAFKPQSAAGQLENRDGDYSLMLNVGYRYSRYLSFEFDIWAFEQDVDTPATVGPPLFGTLDARGDLSGGSLGAVVKLGWPIGRFEPYVGVGGGVYFSTLRLTGSLFGLPATREEDDTSLGTQWLAGADLMLSRQWSVGFEFRRTFLKASFGDLTSGEVEIGGDSLMLTARWHLAPQF